MTNYLRNRKNGLGKNLEYFMKRHGTILLSIAIIFNLTIFGQQTRKLERNTSAVNQTEKRIALIIGNSTYTDVPLKNPVNDANEMAQALKMVGFEVLSYTNLDQNGMKRAIRDFGSKLKTSRGVGLFYYAGHGVQVRGVNYLIPIGATANNEQDIEYEAVEAGLVLAQMEAADNPMNIVILDACRNNPFARSFRSADKGLAQMNPPSGSLIAYSTAPGSVASDGTGKNGLYTAELLKKLKTPNLSIEEILKQVRISVRNQTQGNQTPWESSSLTGDFYFVKNNEKTSGSASKTDRVLSDAAQQHFQKGNELFINGDKESATDEYRKAVEIEPNRAAYQYSLGYALASQIKNLEAEPHLREAVRLEPKDAQYRYYLAFCLRVIKKFEEAEKQIREAIKLAPQKAEYQYELGNLFYSLGRLTETEAAYQEAVRLEPQNEWYLSNLNVIKATIKANSLQKTNKNNNDVPVEKTDKKQKTQTANEHFFTFDLKQCRISGSTVACDLLITNNESGERPLNFYKLDFGPVSKIFDDQGNEAKISDNGIANRGNYETATMLPEVAVKAKAVFNNLDSSNVSADAKELKLVVLYFATLKNGFIVDSFKIEYKNVLLVK